MFSNISVNINFQPLIDLIVNMGTALWNRIASTKSELTSDIATAKGEAISAAAGDATTKANAAQAAASVDATTKANNAQSAAISAAATDATTKANSAQAAAISAAATDATNKASSAQSTAISTAAADATTKADAAQAAAATDATTKANAAESNAKSYAETKASEAQTAAQNFASSQVSGVVNGESEFNTLKKAGDKLRAIDAARVTDLADLDAVKDIALNGGSGRVILNLTGLTFASFIPKQDKDGEAVLGQTTYSFEEQSDNQTVLLDQDLSAYSQLSPYLDGNNKLTVGHHDDLIITWGGTIASPVITDVKYSRDKTHELVLAGLQSVASQVDASIEQNVADAATAILAGLPADLVAAMGN